MSIEKLASELDANLQELRRLTKLLKQLEPLAVLFEQTNSSCVGECDHPQVAIIQCAGDKAIEITCCNLRVPYERYVATRTLRRMLRRKVDNAQAGRHEEAQKRRRELVQAMGLSKLHPRTHSGTWVRLKRLVVPEGLRRRVSGEHEEIPKGTPTTSPSNKPTERT